MSKEEKAEVGEELRHGPVSDRSCTDILCCLIFLAFIGFALFINVQSLFKGDITKVARPYDVDGRLELP